MDQTTNVVDLVSNLLDSEKYKEALNVPQDDKYSQSFVDNCWDLISVIVGKIQDETLTIKPSLQNTCEELLSVIIQKAKPEESLLELIEQIELAKNDAQFILVLSPLQQVVNMLPRKRSTSIEWCLNSILTYLDNIPVPEHRLERRERLLMDCDRDIRRIVKLYSELPIFYEPFIIGLQNFTDNQIYLKQIIVAFLISLLGKPMIYIDLDPEFNAKSEVRLCCFNIIKGICVLEKDLLKFLFYVECNDKSKLKLKQDDADGMPYNHKEKINMTTLSGLFYVVFAGHFELPETAIPQVYNNLYIVHTVMLTVIYLLSNFTEYGPVSKGIFVCEKLMNRLSYPVPHTLLQLDVYYNLSKSLASVAIYSTYENLRKNAVHLMRDIIHKFEYEGRYKLIKFLLNVSNHSGIIGYVISLYKNSINEAFKSPESFPDCFKGPQLVIMINKICHLSHGVETDLVEIADEIITTLNFIRYLALKDITNITGIKKCFPTIENNYLDKLRVGLNMSKAHYEAKLKEIEEDKETKENSNVTITVGGNVLDKISNANKKEIILSALNAFHLMEGLIARVSECIKLNKTYK